LTALANTNWRANMTDIALAFFIGFLVGLVMRPKDKDMLDDVLERNEKYRKYEEEIKYYKDLCKWHVEQRNNK
jgi:hypothetical protein